MSWKWQRVLMLGLLGAVGCSNTNTEKEHAHLARTDLYLRSEKAKRDYAIETARKLEMLEGNQHSVSRQHIQFSGGTSFTGEEKEVTLPTVEWERRAWSRQPAQAAVSTRVIWGDAQLISPSDGRTEVSTRIHGDTVTVQWETPRLRPTRCVFGQCGSETYELTIPVSVASGVYLRGFRHRLVASAEVSPEAHVQLGGSFSTRIPSVPFRVRDGGPVTIPIVETGFTEAKSGSYELHLTVTLNRSRLAGSVTFHLRSLEVRAITADEPVTSQP